MVFGRQTFWRLLKIIIENRIFEKTVTKILAPVLCMIGEDLFYAMNESH